MGKNKRMTMIIIAGVLLLTVIGVAFAYFAVSVINGTRQNLSATTVESVNLTLDDNDSTTYSGQVSFGSTVTRNLKLTNEGGPTKVALYFQDLINTYTAGAFTYTLSYATTQNGNYTSVATDVAIPRRSKASSTAKITEIEMPATSTRYYRIVITYNNLPEVNQTRDLTAQFNTGFTIKEAKQTISEAHPNGDYLKGFCVEDTSYTCRSKVFGKDTMYKYDINSIQFVNSNVVPNGATSWDVSQGQNGSVMAWAEDVLEEKVYANSEDCNTALEDSLEVTECRTVPTYNYYVAKIISTGALGRIAYVTLEECQNAIKRYTSSDYTCAEQFSTTKGYYPSGHYNLYIGQEGGVIANPDSSYMFLDYRNLESLDLTYLDTSYVENMMGMFQSVTTLSTVDLSHMDTSNVTNMSQMFTSSLFSSLDLSNFDTSNVTNMSNMFSSNSSLTNLNLSNLDTANVTNMAMLFYENKGLESINLSSFDTSNVTTMDRMFYNSSANANLRDQKITILDLSNFDTASLENMNQMFCGQLALTNLDVSSFDTGNVKYMYEAFRYVGVTDLDLSHFNTENVINMTAAFANCYNLKTLNLSNFDTSNVTSVGTMFSGSYVLEELRLNKATFDSVTSSNNFLSGTGTSAVNPLKIYVNSNGKSFIDTNFSDYSSNVVLV